MSKQDQETRDQQARQMQEAALQQQQLQQIDQQQTGDRARLLEVAVHSELDSPSEELENLKARDFPLSNYDEGRQDTFEFKGVQEILSLLDEVRYPHEESVLQGSVREYAFDDPGESLAARSPGEAIVNESYLLGTYSRAKRGEGGFERETNAKETREVSTVGEESQGKSGGLRNKIPGL